MEMKAANQLTLKWKTIFYCPAGLKAIKRILHSARKLRKKGGGRQCDHKRTGREKQGVAVKTKERGRKFKNGGQPLEAEKAKTQILP